jgi:hypothetical protein
MRNHTVVKEINSSRKRQQKGRKWKTSSSGGGGGDSGGSSGAGQIHQLQHRQQKSLMQNQLVHPVIVNSFLT